MAKSFDLIAIDKSWVDLLIEVPRLPGADEKVLGVDRGRHPGGMGNNVACAGSRLGLRTGVVSWVGDDSDGQAVQQGLRGFRVDITHLTLKPDTRTNYTVVLVDPTGEKRLLVVPTSFDTLILDAAMQHYLGQARIVYTTPYDLEQLARVAATVHASGGLLATDLEPVAGLGREKLDQIMSEVDILFANRALVRGSDLEEAALGLQARGPRLVAVTAGAAGAAVCLEGQSARAAAFDVPVRDTTGAGDCFAAAFMAAFLRRQPLEDALLYAQAAAAITVRESGLWSALPTDGQIREFLRVSGVKS